VLERYKQSVLSMVIDKARPSPPAKLAPRAAVGSRVDCHECDLCASWREGSFTTLDHSSSNRTDYMWFVVTYPNAFQHLAFRGLGTICSEVLQVLVLVDHARHNLSSMFRSPLFLILLTCQTIFIVDWQLKNIA